MQEAAGGGAAEPGGGGDLGEREPGVVGVEGADHREPALKRLDELACCRHRRALVMLPRPRRRSGQTWRHGTAGAGVGFVEHDDNGRQRCHLFACCTIVRFTDIRGFRSHGCHLAYPGRHRRRRPGRPAAIPSAGARRHRLGAGGEPVAGVLRGPPAGRAARGRTVELLRSVGLGKRLDAEGIEHDGIYLQFAGERHNLNFRELTGGRRVTVYAQTEIVKDLIARRLADGGAIEFSASDVTVSGVTADRPVLSYTDAAGSRTRSPAT